MTSAALAVAAAAIAAFWLATGARARRAILAAAALLFGLLLSLEHLAARRLSALLFLLSILLAAAVWRLSARGAAVRRTVVTLLVVLFVGWKAARLQAVALGALHLPLKYLPSAAWLGGSYILFRLIHAAVESGKPGFPRLSALDFVLYALFPATLVAGPIARVPEFETGLAYERPPFSAAAEGARRILVGVFKKFVIADFIATLPIDFAHAGLSTPRMWASLYLFGFQLFFDFAGYSDMAIGAAALVGFRIPENFASPYTRPNITRFWQSWHATLSGWMRDYAFFPLGRLLRRRAPRLPAWLAALTCQVATMVLIGIWHGFFLGYAVWGVWHGIGLFLHREWTRARGAPGSFGPLRHAGAVFVTFQFVMVGWVFFYGTSLKESALVLQKLVGR